MKTHTVDALSLRPGNQIKFRKGVMATVTRRTARERNSTVTIHTDKGDVLPGRCRGRRLMGAHHPHWPPMTAETLRTIGLIAQVLGWLTLLAAVVVFALVDGHGGMIAALILLVLGLAKILVGLHWRSRGGP
jgi:hypothetical protein